MILAMVEYGQQYLPRKKAQVYLTPRTISVQPNEESTYTFDLEGRPLVFMREGRCYVRSLDGRIKEKSWASNGTRSNRIIRDLSNRESADLMSKIYHELEEFQARIQIGYPHDFHIVEPNNESTSNSISATISTVLSWSPSRFLSDNQQFHEIYNPINILPPDQYYAIALQIVEGCSWNKCTFCNFYEGRSFRIRPIDEIETHMIDVKNFLGKSLKLRRSIFLCDANSLIMKSDDLQHVLELAKKHFPEQSIFDGGISTFGDVPSILGKNAEELNNLSKAGLKRVYIGMESGSDELRRLIKKPGRKIDLVHAVNKLKSAGIEVGLIILLGIGGHEFEKIHLFETVKAIKEMQLDGHDIIYFSPYYPNSGSILNQSLKKASLPSLPKEKIDLQFKNFISDISYLEPKPQPVMATYDIREFVL